MSWIEIELSWLETIIEKRIQNYFENSSEKMVIERPELPSCFYKDFLEINQLSLEERVVIAIGISYELSPEKLDVFLTKNKLYDKVFSEFGGYLDQKNSTFIPTIKTALFILGGNNKERHIELLTLFERGNKLYKNGILEEFIGNEERKINHRILLNDNALNVIFTGKDKDYEQTLNFPAAPLSTNYTWDDLVLGEHTAEHLEELELWLNHSDTLLDSWSMDKFLKKGYKALFYGPPGTGKTLTATLLGKKFNKKVYRVDLSQIVSKYIGETEKNLEKIFKSAENKDWILFFDEADSLFGKRTGITSSNDKHANQETAYLLQKVEESSCMIILATNLKDNFDEAFLRRFQSAIYFPIPDENEREKLWKNGFSVKADLKNIDIKHISYKYELSGANIMNVVRFSSLMAIKNSTEEIREEDVITGIRREKFKEGKII